MLKSDILLDEDLPNVKVGIGCAPDSKFVEVSVRALNNPNVIIYRDPQKLADDLASGKIDAAVRGDMSSSKLLPLIKKALNLETASGRPNRDKVGQLTQAQVREIATTKMPDLNAASIEAAMSMIKGTARSMGVTVADE